MWQDDVKAMLSESIVPFWQGLRDEIFGGYYGYMDFDLKVDFQADKGCILNSRILWFFSKAFIYLKDKELLQYAEHAFCFMHTHFYDPVNGGVFWSVQYNGNVKDDSKHVYNQAFAIYALSAYYEATRNKKVLEMAKEIFKLIEEKCTDIPGYKESFTRDFSPADNEKLSENGIVAEKTMNSLLHIFEAYSALYEVCEDETVAAAMRNIVRLFLCKVFNIRLGKLDVFFDRSMGSILDLYSYGHDIEAAWLIDWGVSLLDDKELSELTSKITSTLASNVYRHAYHEHSLWNECENGKPDKSRVWWVQAEAIVGFLNEYEKNTGRTEYLTAANEIWTYMWHTLKDPRHGGEFYWDVDENGKPGKKPIVSPWKCPYHHGRMCFEILRRNVNVTP